MVKFSAKGEEDCLGDGSRWKRARKSTLRSAESCGGERSSDDVIVVDVRREEINDNSSEINGGELNLTLGDPGALECPICFECLTIPVYQCKNGHAACASCFPKLIQKCPSCSSPIDYNRCRAIENVLESLKIPCQNKPHGCNETIMFCKKEHHLNSCLFAECSCPVEDCNFTGSSKQIYHHASESHVGNFVPFKFNCEFVIHATTIDKLLVLQEKEEGALFILKNDSTWAGNMITVVRWGPSLLKQRNPYDLSVKSEQCSVKMSCFAKVVRRRSDNGGGLFLMVPSEMICPAGHVCVNVTIWREDEILR